MNHNKTNNGAKDDAPLNHTQRPPGQSVIGDGDTGRSAVKDEHVTQVPTNNVNAQWLQMRARYPALGMCRR